MAMSNDERRDHRRIGVREFQRGPSARRAQFDIRKALDMGFSTFEFLPTVPFAPPWVTTVSSDPFFAPDFWPLSRQRQKSMAPADRDRSFPPRFCKEVQNP